MKKLYFNISLVLCILILASFIGSTPIKYFGFLKATEIRYYQDTAMINKFYQGLAFLPRGGTNKLNAFYCKKSGNLFFNNKPLAFQKFVNAYCDSIGSKDFEGIKWNLSSSDSLPSFSYTCSLGYPIINNPIDLPNSISKSNNVLIDISGVSNFDEVEFIINDSQLKIFTPWYRKLTNVTNFTILKSDLVTLTGPVIQINLLLIKNEEKEFNGKKFKFENRIMLVKNIPLTN